MENHPEPSAQQPNRKQLASVRHTLGLLVLLLAVSAGLFRVQTAIPVADKTGTHGSNVTVYLTVIVSEWALVLYVWLGLRRNAVQLRDLIGGRWINVKAFLLDIAVAAGFWLVWTAAAIGMNSITGPSHAAIPGFLTPQGAVEVTLWVAMSMTAGFCEELIYRGYLQRQVLALTNSVALAVLVQAVIFGVGHWYQGSKQVIVITVLGVLFGILAYWRKSLRPGMISHAWSDILNVIPIHFP